MSPSRPSANVSFENHGRVVLVTGASMGIGSAIAQAFADSGAHVYNADITAPSDKDTDKIKYLSCDTASETDCSTVVEQVVQEHGAIDVLVNNAAI